jgi:hypothetical protein
MKRPCQAFAGRRVVDHLMSGFRGCFRARFTCPPGLAVPAGWVACGCRWPGRVAGGRPGAARFSGPGAAEAPGSRPARRAVARSAMRSSLDAGGAAPYASGPAGGPPRTAAAGAGGGGAPGRDGGVPMRRACGTGRRPRRAGPRPRAPSRRAEARTTEGVGTVRDLGPGRSHVPVPVIMTGASEGRSRQLSEQPPAQPAAHRSATRRAYRAARRPVRRPPRPTRPAPGRQALPWCRSAQRSGRRWSARR